MVNTFIIIVFHGMFVIANYVYVFRMSFIIIFLIVSHVANVCFR